MTRSDKIIHPNFWECTGHQFTFHEPHNWNPLFFSGVFYSFLNRIFRCFIAFYREAMSVIQFTSPNLDSSLLCDFFAYRCYRRIGLARPIARKGDRGVIGYLEILWIKILLQESERSELLQPKKFYSCGSHNHEAWLKTTLLFRTSGIQSSLLSFLKPLAKGMDVEAR